MKKIEILKEIKEMKKILEGNTMKQAKNPRRIKELRREIKIMSHTKNQRGKGKEFNTFNIQYFYWVFCGQRNTAHKIIFLSL